MTVPEANLHKLGGTGPDLLFIHGFGSDRYSWAANAPQLTDAATVWAVDLPGHGGAADAVGDGTALTLAQAVAGQLSALSGPAVVVGHSLGGAVAVHLTGVDPNLVRRLVLITPAGLGDGLDHAFMTNFPDLDAPDAAQALLERLVERKRLIAPAMVAHVLTMLQNPVRRAALTTIAGFLLQNAPLCLPGIPVDLIWGEADAINPLPAIQPPAASFLSLPGTGHMPQVEAASKVNAVIRAALTS